MEQMITWAALLVLQGVEGGVGESDGEITPSLLSPHFLSFSLATFT
jgi:hypothetical protein